MSGSDRATTTGEPGGWRERRPDPSEPREIREKRLRVRCWRRGTREMDLILGGYFDAVGSRLSADELDAFEALLRFDDGDLYRWVAGAGEPPAEHGAAVARLRAHAGF